MNDPQAIGDLVFHIDFGTARRRDGSVIRFTPTEARLLAHMVRHADRVLTRDQLLDAISEPGSDHVDRNVDFVVSRLRRKLGDDATDPRFIATRYGEGYVWLAPPRDGDLAAAGAHLVIGPVRSPADPPELSGLTHDLAGQLLLGARAHLPGDRSVVLVPDFERGHLTGADEPELAMELTVFDGADGPELVLAARSARTGHLLDVTRQIIPTDPHARAAFARDLAVSVLGRLWRARAMLEAAASPLPVAMHDAAEVPRGTQASWAANDDRLHRLRAEHPDDEGLKLMQAAHIHSKYVMLGHDLFFRGVDDRARDEDEIERLVLDSLPFAQPRPDQAALAAKLLHFLDRGYLDLATGMAEDALRTSTAVGSTLAIVGQMRAFRGETQGALHCLRQAAQLSERNSEFHIYVLVMVCQAAIAGGDRDALSEARDELYALRPAARFFFEPMFTDPDRPSLRARGAVMLLSRARSRALLRFLGYVSVRLFAVPEHRENAVRTPLRLLMRRFGPGVVPGELADLVPGLIAS